MDAIGQLNDGNGTAFHANEHIGGCAHGQARDHLSPTWLQDLLARANSGRTWILMDEKVCDGRFAVIARRIPQAPAVLDSGRVFTFGEIDERSELIARWLSAHGAGPERVVAILVSRSADLPACVLGVWRSGAAYLALDDEMPRARLASILAEIRPAAVLTQRHLRHRLPADLAPLLCADGGIPPQPPARPIPRWPDQLAYVIHTSGSTGTPKRVAVSHRSLLTILDDWRRVYRLGSEVMTVLQAAGFGFDVATGDLVRGLLTGACLITCPRATLLSPPDLYALMRQTGAAFAELTPSLLRPLVGYLRTSGERLDFMHCLVAGGERLTRADFIQTREVTGQSVRVFNTYGLTEAAVDNSYCELGGAAPDSDIMPIGRGFAGTELFVLDGGLREAVEGELFVGGPQLARGYLGDPATTALRFVPAPGGPPGARLYRTGDLVQRLPDGDVMHLGRRDSQVKVRGVRVDPLEIESTLAAHPAAQSAAVVAVQHGGRIELAGYVVPAPGAPLVSASALRRFAAAQLPAAMVPAFITLVKEIPVNQSGKADYSRLPTPEPEARGTPGDGPQQSAEDELLRIWRQTLGRAVTGTDQDFFELGGSSLLAAEVAMRVRDELGADLSASLIYRHPTVAELAAIVTRASAAERIPADLHRTEGPLSPGQNRLWVLHQMGDGLTAYNIPVVVRMTGPVDPGVLRRALDMLIARHAALRTAFVTDDDGRPVQRVTQCGQLFLAESTVADGATADATIDDFARRPFELDRPPLIRAVLLHLPGQEHRLVLTMHHIASDGWTVRILLAELGDLYSALIAGEEPDMPVPPVSYLDFAAWQAGRLRRGELDDQLMSWLARLDDAPGERLLPAATAPGSGPRSCRAELGVALTGAVRDLAREYRTTVFVTMLAAFAALLHRWSGRRDLVIGAPLGDRSAPGTERLAGFFVNTIALRMRLPTEPAFGDLVRLARDSVTHAAGHQDVPFDLVQKELGRSGSGPLFHTWFNFLGAPDPAPQMAGLDTEVLDAPVAGALFDVNLYLTELPDDLRISLVYDSARCDGPDMTAFLEQYVDLLRRLSVDPELPVAVYSLMTAGQPALMPGARPYPSLPALVAEQARRQPHAVAVRAGDDEVSYGQLAARAASVAAQLRANGAGNGRLVAVYAPRGAKLVIALLGTLESGSAFCILDPAYPSAWLARQLAAARPDAILHASEAGPLPRAVLDAAPVILSLDRPADPGVTLAGTPANGPAYVMFTSGTTGEPKPVWGGQPPVVHFLRFYAASFGLRADDRFTLLSGLAHDPLLRDVFAPLSVGAAVCVPPADLLRAPAGLRAWLADQEVTIAHLTPPMIRLLSSGRGPELTRLRLVVSGGDTLHAEDVGLLRDLAPGATVVNAYGTTETPQVMSWEVIPPGQSAGPPGQRICIGRGIDGVQLLVRAPGRRHAAVGEVGHVIVRTPYLTEGLGTEYDTGDLGRLRADGRVELIGRADEQVKIDGFRAELAAVDCHVRRLPYIRDCLTTLGRTVGGRSCLVSYAVPADGFAPTVEQVRTDLRAELPAYLLPARLVLVEQLPLTPNGKHDRAALPRTLTVAAATEAAPPASALEKAIAEIWRSALGGGPVSLDASFFDLGGSSMLMIWVQQKLEAELGRPVPVLALFEYPTVHALAAHLAEPQRDTAARPAPRNWNYPDTQRRLNIRRELELKDLP